MIVSEKYLGGCSIIFDYINQYKLLYKIKPNYGKTSIKLYNDILEIIGKYKIKSILDYGCGKSQLIDMIRENSNIICHKFDPALDEYNALPLSKFDLVICTDVLQHIPLYDLDRVLKEIRMYSNNCFFHIRCSEYSTVLPNGTPANCTVFSKNWWKSKLEEYFDSVSIIKNNSDDIVTITTGIKEGV